MALQMAAISAIDLITFLLALTAAVLIMFPLNVDMIATLGETTGYPGLLYTKNRMESDPVGRQILKLVLHL